MAKASNKKFIFGIPLRTIKIVGLILLVAAQAFPLRAFEAHIVSVTAVIVPTTTPDPPPSSLISDSGQAFALDLSAAAGEQIPALEPALNTDEALTGDTAQADSGSSSAPQDQTVSDANAGQNDNNQNEQGNSAGSASPSVAPSNEPANGGADTSGEGEPPIQTQTEKIEVSSAETVLTIENVTPFQDSSSAAAVSADVVGGGAEGSEAGSVEN